eukprot:2342003-Alexandrium_andersonii.AAC.1
MRRVPSCSRSRGKGATSSPAQSVRAWWMLQVSRRLLVARWSTPVLRVGGRAWLEARPPPRARSGSG